MSRSYKRLNTPCFSLFSFIVSKINDIFKFVCSFGWLFLLLDYKQSVLFPSSYPIKLRVWHKTTAQDVSLLHEWQTDWLDEWMNESFPSLFPPICLSLSSNFFLPDNSWFILCSLSSLFPTSFFFSLKIFFSYCQCVTFFNCKCISYTCKKGPPCCFLLFTNIFNKHFVL